MGGRRMKPARGSRRRGASLIEFALTFTLLLTLAVGAMEGARAIWTYITLAHAARSASRYAMVRGGSSPVSDADIEAYLLARSPGLDSSALTTSVVWEPDSEVGSAVEVRLGYSFQFIAGPLLGVGPGIRLFSSSRMLVAN